MSSEIKEQKPPVPNFSKPVWEMVIEDMKERDNFGRERYGTPLQIHNSRSFLVDAYQEALDLVVYLRGLIEENKEMKPINFRCAICDKTFQVLLPQGTCVMSKFELSCPEGHRTRLLLKED